MSDVTVHASIKNDMNTTNIEIDIDIDIEIALYKYYSYTANNKQNLDPEPDAELVKELLKGPRADSITIKDIDRRLARIRGSRDQLRKLRAMPQVEQRSPEWYAMRQHRLTASAISQSIGKGKFATRNALLKSKAFPEQDKVFDSYKCAPLRHGIMLEDMTARCYTQRRNNVRVHSFGMIPHPTLSCFGASPDGINDLGIMIEIKTPYSRKVGGAVPNEYMLQMQGQMAVCGLHECDFVDAEITMSPNIDEYLREVQAGAETDHGIIVEYFNAFSERLFDYSPPNMTPQQCFQWGMEKKKERIAEHGVNNVLLLQTWRLIKLHVERVLFDKSLWDSLVPGIEAFWADVIAMREGRLQLPEPIQHRPRTKKTLDIDIDQGEKKTDYAFVDSDED